MEKIVCNFIAVYRKTYSSNHVLIRLTENWKTTSWQEKDRDSSYGSIKNISTNDLSLKKDLSKSALNTNCEKLTMESCVILLGIEID